MGRSGSARDRVEAALARQDAVSRADVWISAAVPADLRAAADSIDARVDAGESLPLAGLLIAVKDNIDVAGFPTTAGCPAFAYRPERSATAVHRLVEAGALVVGKTNLDQFATGLVGTRSPYGAVASATDPAKISGGSSSGSAVAVALELADVALGTDTAGSGRVPAAFQGIFGIKPTRGLVPNSGIVPACQELDCVSIFSRDAATGYLAFAQLVGADDADPYSRQWPPDAPLMASPAPTIGVVDPASLVEMSPQWQQQYATVVESLDDLGISTVEVDIAPLREAAALLYGGALVASRYTAVGEFIRSHYDECDPVVAQIITAAAELPAHQLAADQHRVAALAKTASKMFSTVSALLLPTVPSHPSLADVAADPVGVNARLGAYTNFANVLDLCAVAVPAGQVDDDLFGVSLFAPAFHDGVIADLAVRLGGRQPAAMVAAASIGFVVVGAHLTGQPLNGQLTSTGSALVRPVQTAPSYRLFDLGTVPPKPGLVRVGAGGASIDAELWALPPVALAQLMQTVPAPLAIGRVDLADGSSALGFLCESIATEGRSDISAWHGWLAYRDAQAQ